MSRLVTRIALMMETTHLLAEEVNEILTRKGLREKMRYRISRAWYTDGPVPARILDFMKMSQVKTANKTLAKMGAVFRFRVTAINRINFPDSKVGIYRRA